MLESLAFALVKTLITFMFEQHLENMQSIRMQSAPGWYYQQKHNQICDSGVAFGRLNAVEQAKDDARRQMILRLQKAMDTVAYEKFRDRTDPAERALINQFTRDPLLPVFVESSVVYENLEYREKQAAAYARVCLSRERLQDYQQERVVKLTKAVTVHRAEMGDRELDEETLNMK